MNFSIFSGLLPDLITTVEMFFGKESGSAKLEKALELFKAFLTAAKAPGWVISGLMGLAPILINVIVAKYNLDPANTLFINSPTPPSNTSPTT